MNRMSKLATAACGALIAATALSACANKNKIETVQETSTGFPASQFQTFAIDHDPHQLKDGRHLEESVGRMVHVSVVDALKQKGYVEVSDRSQADFLVEYVVGLEEWIELSEVVMNQTPATYDLTPRTYGTYEMPYMVPKGAEMDVGPTLTRPTAKQLRQGSIAVHILSPDGRDTLWGATSTKLLNKADARHREAVVKSVVDHTLQDFPAKAK